MALTPQQAIQLGPGDYDEVQKLEKEIDGKLLTSFNVALQRFDFFFPIKDKETGKRSLKVIFELQRRYQVAGWEVNLVRDGEECSGLVLVAPDAPILPVLQPPTSHQRLMGKGESATAGV